jgi:hypothetical protein
MPTPTPIKLVCCLLLAAIPLATRAANRVSLNPYGVLVINDRKVFPIGFTLGPPPDAKTPDGKNGLEELAQAGATFIRTGANGHDWNEATFASERKWEDAAARAGLYCWPFLRELAAIDHNPKREALLRRVVTEFKDSPGLGVWKGTDEPEWGKAKVAALVRARDIIHELDPNHPLAIIQAPRGTIETLRPYNAAADIIGLDIYPISYPPGQNSRLPNKEISMVGDYTREMLEVGSNQMPVWMILQIAWSGVVKPGKTLRFPTFAEERFMTYDAIINGARGLVYFGGNLEKAMSPEDARLGWNWTFWNHVLRRVIEEIGSHSPLAEALVAPASKLPIQVSAPADIEFCVREVGADIYILACRRQGSTTEVTFSNLPQSATTGEVLYESPRQVSAAKGKFSDWFGPFEVHVYHFKTSSTQQETFH